MVFPSTKSQTRSLVQAVSFENVVTFSNLSPVSVAKCPELTPPRNGSVRKCSAHPVFGESCHVSCNMGFKSSDDRALVCERDDATGRTSWNRAPPECIREQQELPSCLAVCDKEQFDVFLLKGIGPGWG